MLFDLIGDREILHRDVALALNVAEQLVATHPESSRALTGCEICSHYPKPDGQLPPSAAERVRQRDARSREAPPFDRTAVVGAKQ